MKVMVQTINKYYFLTKLIGPCSISVCEGGGDWVRLLKGFRIWRFMFAFIEVDKI